MKKLIGRFFCRIGFHAWEKDPSEKEPIKNTGHHIGFWSRGIQKGVRHCTRHSCGCSQKVHRQGWCGIGGENPGWKKLNNPQLESRIDSLPGILQG